MKIHKKNLIFFFFFFGGGGLGQVRSGRGGRGGASGWGGEGGCEQRSKVFVKIKKKLRWGFGVGWGGPIRVWGGGGGVARFGVGG